MRRARHILGLPVFSLANGRRLGSAKDIVIDRNWRAVGLLLDAKAWFGPEPFIAWEDVLAFGMDALTLTHEGAVRLLARKQRPGRLLQGGGRCILGMPVLTEQGEQLGRIEDVYFADKMDKKIIGCELSEGFLTDVTEGRKWLPIPEASTLGNDAVFVSAPSGSLMPPRS